MKYINPLLFALLLIFNFCKNTNNEHYQAGTEDIEVITVGIPGNLSGNYDELFSKSEIVKLETNRLSLIGNIARIIVFKDQIYILDNQTNSVVVFNKSGKFLHRIQHLGKGKGEYIGLRDFALDKSINQLVLYSHRPYKLLHYGLDGKFIREQRLTNVYSNIAVSGEDILLVNTQKDRKFSLFLTKDGDGDSNEGFLPISNAGKHLQNFSTPFPLIINSEHVLLTFLYSDIIYEYKNSQIKARYKINFGSKAVSESLYNSGKTPEQIFRYAIDNQLGFAIANFRENKNTITFTYGKNIVVVYSKKDKTVKLFDRVLNEKDHLLFYNYFAHDGDDNTMIAIYPAEEFKKHFKSYRKDVDTWSKIPERLKSLDNRVMEDDNPLLVINTLK